MPQKESIVRIPHCDRLCLIEDYKANQRNAGTDAAAGPAGYAVFRMLDTGKLQQPDNLFREFESTERAAQLMQLVKFVKFDDTVTALGEAQAMIEGKVGKKLKKMLKKLVNEEAHEELAVADAKLGSAIKDKIGLECVTNSAIQELMRCVRSQFEQLIADMITKKDQQSMMLGLSHNISRHKLKFNPEKVDTMIIQAVSLLDDLDKEVNNYVMRLREWVGWHFPELGKIITEHATFLKVVQRMRTRDTLKNLDLSDILPADLEANVKEAAELSMGTEMSPDDVENIMVLCGEVEEMIKYRQQLSEYLTNRMRAVAPSLTVLLGELVGARLISHAGSVIGLAKYPASTIQILGAEKALFRALKKKHDTPKYGMIYHSPLIGQTPAALKGKISRVLAAKAALAVRWDALAETSDDELGVALRKVVEERIKLFEKNQMRRVSGPAARQKPGFEKYQSSGSKSAFGRPYNEGADFTNNRGGGRGGGGGGGGWNANNNNRGGGFNNKRSYDDANAGGSSSQQQQQQIPGPTSDTPFKFQKKLRFADSDQSQQQQQQQQSAETTAEPSSGAGGSSGGDATAASGAGKKQKKNKNKQQGGGAGGEADDNNNNNAE